MTNCENKYRNSKIYTIRNRIDDDIYIGSTVADINKRFYRHKIDAQNPALQHMPLHAKMKECGIEHFYIELLEKVKCNDRSELNQREGEWIRKIGTLNKYKHNNCGLTVKEYYNTNRADILNQKKEYYEKNKEKIKTYSKEYVKRTGYNKSYYDRNKELIAKKSKIYYERNRERILQQKKEYKMRLQNNSTNL